MIESICKPCKVVPEVVVPKIPLFIEPEIPLDIKEETVYKYSDFIENMLHIKKCAEQYNIPPDLEHLIEPSYADYKNRLTCKSYPTFRGYHMSGEEVIIKFYDPDWFRVSTTEVGETFYCEVT